MTKENEPSRAAIANEFNRRRVLAGGAVLGATGWLDALPQRALAQAAKRGGTLIIALDNNPPALTILASTATLTNCTSGQFFNTLMKFTNDYKLVPSLAPRLDRSARWQAGDTASTTRRHLARRCALHFRGCALFDSRAQRQI